MCGEEARVRAGWAQVGGRGQKRRKERGGWHTLAGPDRGAFHLQQHHLVVTMLHHRPCTADVNHPSLQPSFSGITRHFAVASSNSTRARTSTVVHSPVSGYHKYCAGVSGYHKYCGAQLWQ